MQNSKFKIQNYNSKLKISREVGYPSFAFCVLRFDFARKRAGFTPLENPSSLLPISSSLHLRRHRHHGVSNSLTGFTMVEVVILMAMLILIMGIVLASFPAFSQRLNVKHSSQRLALSLRKVQNMAFAVRQVNTSCGPVVPAYYGIYLNTASDPGSYVVFADLPSDPANACRRVQADGLYGSGNNDLIVETVQLDPGISLERLGTQSQDEGILNITFSVPEARMKISDEHSPAGEYAEIFLAAGDTNFRRSVFIRTSGQIYVK